MNYDILRKSVQDSNLTKSKLASELGIARNTLDNILNGTGDPRVSLIEKLAKLVKLRPAMLFDGVESYVCSIGTGSTAAGRDVNYGRSNTKLLIKVKELEARLSAAEELAQERKKTIDLLFPLVSNFQCRN